MFGLNLFIFVAQITKLSLILSQKLSHTSLSAEKTIYFDNESDFLTNDIVHIE